MNRLLVAAVALLMLPLGGGIVPTCAQPIVLVSPSAGAVIDSFDFEIRVELAASGVDADSLEVELNGYTLWMAGGPTVFTHPAGPGPALRDDNLLVARVVSSSGGSFSRQVQFSYLPPKARARRIQTESDRIRGPLGQSEIGDWLLENSVARFAIQDAPRRDLHSIGQYGGNLIDAELVALPGRDSFFEIQPSTNIETVVNAQTVEIVNDGSDGQAAVVRTCGPDDLIDYANPSSQIAQLGFDLPPGIDDLDYDIEACTEYRLEPLATHIEMKTTLFNLTGQELGFYVGDYLNGMGSLEQWTLPVFAVGELQISRADAQSYFGFGEAEGVDYALVPVPIEGGSPTTSFTVAGVTFQLQSHSIPLILILGEDAEPVFFVPAGGSNSFSRLFGVGDGSPSNAVALMNRVTGAETGTMSGCVTAGGAPAPGARVAVGPLDNGGDIESLVSLFVADVTGCYAGELPAGDYGASASLSGAPFEGDAATPPVHSLTIASSPPVSLDFALPARGRLEVVISDANGLPVPARVTVVGLDDSLEPTVVGSETTGLFRDVTKDPLSFGLVTFAYTNPAGFAGLDVEPGDYQVYVSRGTEYSLWSSPVTITGGETAVLDAAIAPVLDTAGFISSDYHVHLINSPDSRVSRVNRTLSFAGEGVDNLIATEHDALTDLDPTIRSLGLAPFLHSTVGEEITSFDYGHYNGYPQARDPARTSGGSTDWARAAPAGEDFPALGNFVRTPAEIDAEAVGKPQNAGLETVVQINHISSHFGPLRIDTSLEPPQSLVPDPGFFRLDPSVPNFFHPFAALELWNGASSGAQDDFLDERIGIWMNLLNQGIATTAIADTDTHTFTDLRTAGARSWTPSSTDAPIAIDDNEIGLAVKGGRLVGGQGPYVQARLDASSTGEVADFTLAGSTLARTTDGGVDLEIDIQSPVWAPYDSIEIYANAATTVAGTTEGTPTLFGAVPTRTLTAGADFTVTEVPVAAVPGGSRLETQHTEAFAGLATDTWFVVVVKGTVGTSPSMFPVFVRNLSPAENPTLAELVDNTLGESGVRALGFTNALYLDVDGDGDFDAPGVQVAP